MASSSDSIARILNQMSGSRMGRFVVLFAVSFVCLFVAAIAAGFSGFHFALLLAGCGAAADGLLVGLRAGKPGGRMDHLGWSMAVIIGSGAVLLTAALIFREIVKRLLQ